MEYDLISHLKTAGVFALMGLVIMGLVWILIVKIVPFSMRKEMEEDQNIALGIVMGSVLLGMSIIIAAAIHG